MRSCLGPLPTLEVAIGRRNHPLASTKTLATRKETHRAARLSPLETRLPENFVQPLGFGCSLDRHRSRYADRAYARCHAPTLQNFRGASQVGEATVGARADERRGDRERSQRGSDLQSHVGERARMCLAAGATLLQARHLRIDRDRVLGARTPSHHRCQVTDIDHDLAIERRAVVGDERSPVDDGVFPERIRRRKVPTPQVCKSLFIRRDETRDGRELGRHVAKRESRLDVELAHRRSSELDRKAVATHRAVPRDQGQRHIFGRGTGWQTTLEAYAQGARLADAQGTGGECMLGLGRADAPGERTERALRAGVTVGTHHGRTRQHDSELRRDDVHDALQRIADVE